MTTIFSFNTNWVDGSNTLSGASQASMIKAIENELQVGCSHHGVRGNVKNNLIHMLAVSTDNERTHMVDVSNAKNDTQLMTLIKNTLNTETFYKVEIRLTPNTRDCGYFQINVFQPTIY